MKIFKAGKPTETYLTIYSKNGRDIEVRVNEEQPNTFETIGELEKYISQLEINIYILLEEDEFMQDEPTEQDSAWEMLLDKFDQLMEGALCYV